jgi:hypothetical protein
MKKLYDIEIVVCPELLDKQTDYLLDLADNYSDEWSDEKMEAIAGLINMLDSINSQINNLAN